MDLTNAVIEAMSEAAIEAIIKWHYEPPYDLYSFNDDENTRNDLTHGNYYVLKSGKELLGFYCCGRTAQIPIGHLHQAYLDEDYLDFGLGMNPRYVGQGFGREFMERGLTFFNETYDPKGFRLTVFDHNLRARLLYRNLGFRTTLSFPSQDEAHQCLVMVNETVASHPKTS